MNVTPSTSQSLSTTDQSFSMEDDLSNLQRGLSNEWLDTICLQVINDMNKYGICVIDNFLGEARGDLIVNEVRTLYKYSSFQEGQLVRNDSRIRSPSLVIRGDKIIWVDGSERNCTTIRYMIQTLDTILARCSRMDNNGLFSKYKITSRTNAMIACYPGCGTHYVKHVDNPHEDGRRITSIYYLNKDWDVQVSPTSTRRKFSKCKFPRREMEACFDFIRRLTRIMWQILPHYSIELYFFGLTDETPMKFYHPTLSDLL